MRANNAKLLKARIVLKKSFYDMAAKRRGWILYEDEIAALAVDKQLDITAVYEALQQIAIQADDNTWVLR